MKIEMKSMSRLKNGIFWNNKLDWLGTFISQILDPYCTVNNRSNLDRIICDCRHMSKFSASVLVAPNLVDPIMDASLLLTVMDNPAPVLFIGVIFIVYFILLVWARRQDKLDRERGRKNCRPASNRICGLLL